MSASNPLAFDAIAWLEELCDQANAELPAKADTPSRVQTIDATAGPIAETTSTTKAGGDSIAVDALALDAMLGDPLELDGERAPFGPDGWPIDTTPPPPTCRRCGSLDAWLPMAGPSATTHPESWKPEAPAWRCLRCDAPERSERTRAHALRLRTAMTRHRK